MTTPQRARELAKAMRLHRIGSQENLDIESILEYHASLLEVAMPENVEKISTRTNDRAWANGQMLIDIIALLDAVRVLTERRDHYQKQRDDLSKGCLEAQAERDAARAEVERMKGELAGLRELDDARCQELDLELVTVRQQRDIALSVGPPGVIRCGRWHLMYDRPFRVLVKPWATREKTIEEWQRFSDLYHLPRAFERQ